MMILWNSPLARGMASRLAVLAPPPDCPKTVTFPGSPPKAAMLSRTHSSARTMSTIPATPAPAKPTGVVVLPGAEAEQAKTVVDRHHDDVLPLGEDVGVEGGLVPGTGQVGPAMQPHHHRDGLIVSRPATVPRC